MGIRQFPPPPTGSVPYATSASFPATATAGDLAVAIDTGIISYFNGTSWVATGSGGTTSYVLTFTSSANQTFGTSFGAVTGMTAQTVNSMDARTYHCFIYLDLFAFPFERDATLSIYVDSTTDNAIQTLHMPPNGGVQRVSGWVDITLTSGTHTFAPRVKSNAGSDLGTNDLYTSQIVLL